jgi:hypothetical protein
MNSIDAAINVVVNNASKVDRLISKVSQLNAIVESLNRAPIDFSGSRAVSQLDSADTSLKIFQKAAKDAKRDVNATAKSIDSYVDSLDSIRGQLAKLNPGTKKYEDALSRQAEITGELIEAKEKLTKAEQALASAQSSAAGQESLIKEAKAAQKLIGAINTLTDEYLKYGAVQQRGVRGQILKNQPNSSLAELGAQAKALEVVAANSRIASAEFNRFTIASQIAGQKIYQGRQEQLRAAAFGLSPEAPRANIGRQGDTSLTAARSQILDFVKSYDTVVKSEAAMSAFVSRGSELQSIVPYISKEWKLLEDVINNVNAEMKEMVSRVAGLRGQSSKIQSALGPATPVVAIQGVGEQGEDGYVPGSVRGATLQAFKQQEAYRKKIDDYNTRQAFLQERIEKSRDAGLLTEERSRLLINKLLDASADLERGNLDVAKSKTIEIERQRRQLEIITRNEAKPRYFGIKDLDFQDISGKLSSGGLVPGSPLGRVSETTAAVSLAQQKMREEERAVADAWKMRGGPALPPGSDGASGKGGIYRTGEFSPMDGNRRLTNTLASGAIIEQSLINLQNKGVDTSDRLVRLQSALNDAKRDTFDISLKNLDALSDEVGLAGKYAQLQRQILAGQDKAGESGLQQALKSLQEARGARESFFGGESPAKAIDQIGLDAFGNISRLSTRELKALSATFSEMRAVLDPTIQGFDRLDNQLRETIGNINRQVERRAPDADLLTRRFGPRAGRGISEGLIGGAFPLLFGQGIGASAGGLVGGAAGGFAGGGLGFGLSLIGTAAGSAFDTFNNNLKEVAKNLKDPTASLEAMKTAGLRVTPELEYLVQKLESSGRAAEAQRAVFAELEKQLGAGGVQQLQALNAEQKELDRQWQELSATLTTLLLPAITGTIAIVNDVINGFKGLGSVKLPPWLQKSIEAGTDFQNTIGSVVNPGFGISRLFAQNVVNRGREEAAKQSGAGAEDLTLQKQEGALQAQRQVADEIKSAYRQGFQIQQRAIDLERKTADIRRRIENEIFNKQQELLQRQADNDRKRAQVAIEAVDLEYQKRIANEEGRAAEVLAAEAELLKTRAQGEAEIATAKKLLELDISKRQREAQDYVYNLSREADSIRRETLSFEMEVADYRLEIQRKIENERLIAAAAEKAKGGATAFAVGGAFDTGLKTGPSSVIGGSAPYHQDISFGPNVGLEQQRQLMVALAKAYDDMGRKIELSNEAVKGRIFPLKGSAAEQNKFIADALAAHRSRGGGTGRSAIDFYAPAKGENRFGKSVENVAMYAPIVPGANLSYSKGGGAGASITATQNGQKIFELMHGRTDRALPGMSKMPGSAASATAAPTSTAAQLEKARSQADRRPVIAPVPVGMAAGAMARLNAQDTEIKQEAIALEQRLAQLQEERARQRLYEVARGPIEIRQRQEAVDLAKAELAAIKPISQDKQEAALFEAQAFEILKNRHATDKGILKTTKLQGEEKKKLEQAIADGLTNTEKQIKLDREALKLAQERRFIEAKAGLTQQLAVTGAAEQAGFFGAGASAYTNELLRSGDAAQAMQIAQQTKALENKQAIASIRGELNSLIDSTNIGIKAADGIGSAFSGAFQGVITSSMTAEEALSSFFKDVGAAFIQMATEIIAKQLVMITLQTILKILGAAGGGGGGGFSGGASGFGGSFDAGIPSVGNTTDFSGAFKFADGDAFGSPSLTKFADGAAFTNSIVSSPTLFKFADGGAMEDGVMGEAGPEAIMPLDRGPDGRLGVRASGLREAMGPPPGSPAPSVLNMSFESTVIGGVEYVSREQLEQAMAETRRAASRDGAQRGMTMTLDKIQNSSSTRRKIGV